MSSRTRAPYETAINGAQVPVFGFSTAVPALPWNALAATTQQFQLAGINAWHDLQQDFANDADRVGRASASHDMLELQTEFVMMQAARWVRMLAQCWAGAFDVQSQWVRHAQACAVDVLRSGLHREVGGLTAPFLEPPDDPTPSGMLRWSQNAWMELSNVWLNALKHDLENEPATAVAQA
jgi:hypothetical protein